MYRRTAAGVLRTLLVFALLLVAVAFLAGAFFVAVLVFAAVAFFAGAFFVAVVLVVVVLVFEAVVFLAAGLASPAFVGAASFTGPELPVKGGEVSDGSGSNDKMEKSRQ